MVPLALLLAIVAVVRLPAGRAKKLHVATAVACMIVLAGAVVSTGWWWGTGFDEAEAQGVASKATDRAMVVSFWVAMTASIGVALVGLNAALSRRRLISAR